MMYYALDDNHKVVPITDEVTRDLWRDMDRRRVDRTQVGKCDVSTVFLVIDHNYGDGPPLVFETMIFSVADGGDLDDYCERYATWDKAVAGRAAAVALCRKSIAMKIGCHNRKGKR